MGGLRPDAGSVCDLACRLDTLELQQRELLATMLRLEAVAADSLAGVAACLEGLQHAVGALHEGHTGLAVVQHQQHQQQAAVALQSEHHLGLQAPSAQAVSAPHQLQQQAAAAPPAAAAAAPAQLLATPRCAPSRVAAAVAALAAAASNPGTPRAPIDLPPLRSSMLRLATAPPAVGSSTGPPAVPALVPQAITGSAAPPPSSTDIDRFYYDSVQRGGAVALALRFLCACVHAAWLS